MIGDDYRPLGLADCAVRILDITAADIRTITEQGHRDGWLIHLWNRRRLFLSRFACLQLVT